MKYVADALLRRCGVHIGTLDFRIQQVTPEIADALNMSKAEGVIVGATTEGGAASNCGIMAGDIILLCSGAHGFHVLEPLEMFEIKQGPYSGENDKTRFTEAAPSEIRIKGPNP